MPPGSDTPSTTIAPACWLVLHVALLIHAHCHNKSSGGRGITEPIPCSSPNPQVIQLEEATLR